MFCDGIWKKEEEDFILLLWLEQNKIKCTDFIVMIGAE